MKEKLMENFNESIRLIEESEKVLKGLRGKLPEEVKKEIFSQIPKNSENYEEIKSFIRKL